MIGGNSGRGEMIVSFVDAERQFRSAIAEARRIQPDFPDVTAVTANPITTRYLFDVYNNVVWHLTSNGPLVLRKPEEALDLSRRYSVTQAQATIGLSAASMVQQALAERLRNL